jgi:hypothetical protein
MDGARRCPRQQVRAVRFFEMTRPLDEPIPTSSSRRAGVRPITPDLTAVWRADAEAFQDHWGG